MNALSDISTANDIDQLVDHFYQLVLKDPIIGFFFTDIASIKLSTHLPKISQFWQRQLLGSGNYHNNTFEVHRNIHQHATLTSHHFHRWLYLFNLSIDNLFVGPLAEQAKRRAKGISQSMLTGLENKYAEESLLKREQQGLFFYDPNDDKHINISS